MIDYALTLLAPSIFSFLLSNVLISIYILFVCTKKKPVESTSVPAAVGATGDKKPEEVKDELKKDGEEKKESSKKEKSKKKSLKEEVKSQKEKSKKEKSERKRKEISEREKKEDSDAEKKNIDEKEKEKKEGEAGDKPAEEKKPDEKDGEKKEEEKESAEARTPDTQQTALQILKKEVTLEPNELRFSKEGGIARMMLTNTTGSRIAVKVKCSDNSIFRVNPVFAFVDKDGKHKIEVTRNTAEAKPDKLAIVTVEAPVDAKDPQAVFKETPAGDQTTLGVTIFTN